MTHPMPLALHHLADALMTVPSAKRPALAETLMADAETKAAARSDAVWNSKVFPSHWGQEIESVCTLHRLAVEKANPGTYYRADLTSRDGIQSFEVALAAFLTKVREAEHRVAA